MAVCLDRTSFLNKGAAADYTGQSIAGRLEATYRVASKVSLVGAVEGQRFAAQGFSEKGGADNKFLLTSGDQSGMQSRLEVGARYEDVFRLSNGMQLIIKTQASYIRNESSSPVVRSSFSSLEGTSFDITGTKPLRDGIALSTSLDIPIKSNISIGARVDGEWTKNSRGVNGMVALRVSW